jgi:EAL domain-containing protein (putative c-di-GMP-specific phosphodiesterase class I)/GGDEF domain-containing protein
MTGIGTSNLVRRPMSLATRASLFATGLLALTAAVCAATVAFGFESESRRHQATGAQEVASRVVFYSVAALRRGDVAGVSANAARMASRSEVRSVSVRDVRGRLLAAHGERPLAEERELASGVLADQRARQTRSSGGELLLIEPIRDSAGLLGVAAITIKPQGFRYDAMLALAPFFLWLGCLALVAIPLIGYFVRRALAPLDTLTRFAAKVAEQGEATPIALDTGDEFETLAKAFNQMMARLDASMRKIQQIAFVDPVTALPNQQRFLREVDYFILQAAQHDEIAAVLVFEFQRLPRLMQTLDPDAARDLMRQIAERFTGAVRAVDRLVRAQQAQERPTIVARLGAQDFAALAPRLASPAEAARFAQSLNSALDQSFDWRGHRLSLGALCGVAIAPRDGKDADAVIRHARMALAAAQNTPARLKVFTPSLDRAAVSRLTLEREMRAALEQNEFRAFFQPKINLVTGRIESAEALARWVRPDRTIVSPGRFIPAAEESGLIEPLSNAILREACWKAAAWVRAGLRTKVAVNVSALQFRNERFAEHVLQIVKHAGLPPSQLELEITESIAMEDPERALRLLEPLRAAGVRLAIDDFGCGHSSLAALSKLPFDVIKIDQQFVRALTDNDPQAAAIIEMILALAKTLGLGVVAEGVEKREQAEFLAARGCHAAQGFLYSPAIPADDFLRMLRQDAGLAPEQAGGAEDAA